MKTTVFVALTCLAFSISAGQSTYRKAILLHHSVGGSIYSGYPAPNNVPTSISTYNSAHGYSGSNTVSMDEQYFPGPEDINDNNWYRWHQIFSKGDPHGVTMDALYQAYPVIVVKTCYTSQRLMLVVDSIEAYKSQYRAIVNVMAQHPGNFFVIWTNYPAYYNDPGVSLSSCKFSKWAKDTLATGKDATFGPFPRNVYVFDVFGKLANSSTGLLPRTYVVGGSGNDDDHPSSAAAGIVAPLLVNETFDAAVAYENPPLPITISSFGVTLDNDVTSITFTTLTETNVYRYFVERQNSATTHWDTVAVLNPAGPSTYSAKDTLRVTGTWKYRLNESDINNTTTYFGATAGLKDAVAYAAAPVASPATNPNAVSLYQNFPNPFNPSTTIGYRLQYQSHVKLSIYDILGREVVVLVNTIQSSGEHETRFDASRLSTGIYTYRIQVVTISNQYAETKRFVVAK